MNIALVGDSVFGGSNLYKYLKLALGKRDNVTLLAREGSNINSVNSRLGLIEADTTHLFISCGGRDILPFKGNLRFNVEFGLALKQFEEDYTLLVREAKRLCSGEIYLSTIYNTIPGLSDNDIFGIDLFNKIIIKVAGDENCNLFDLGKIVTSSVDFSTKTLITPSEIGSLKIAASIADAVYNRVSYTGSQVVTVRA